MAHRADLNTMSSALRLNLVNRMVQYITDGVVANHMNINHSGLDLFTGHRAYIAGMEAFLAASGGGQFVPLPSWNPANPIPAEFNVVKATDNGAARPALQSLNPNRPLPAQYVPPAICSFATGADLGNDINGWHGGVHIAIGGAMGDIMIASAAPIFWCWHAFLDHVYGDWLNCVKPPEKPEDPKPPHPGHTGMHDCYPTEHTYREEYENYQARHPQGSDVRQSGGAQQTRPRPK